MLRAEVTRTREHLASISAALQRVEDVIESLNALMNPESSEEKLRARLRNDRVTASTPSESKPLPISRARIMKHLVQALEAEEPTQVELIIRWLFEAPAGLMREEIEERFRHERVSEGWKDFKNSVSSALWRAVQQGLIKQTNEDRFLLPIAAIDRAKIDPERRSAP